jgi:phosphoribulokinase
MSVKHPIIAITGSSGAGTSTVMQAFHHVFRRESLKAQIIEGDSFHRYDRMAMRGVMKEQEALGNRNFSHFGPEANLLAELEQLFVDYGRDGTGKVRKYLHDAGEAEPYGQEPGTFTPWADIQPGTDLMFYEGLHGGYADDKINVAKQVDLLIGVVPTINLEWIQKLHRDQKMRGYSQEAVTDTILRRMPDYVSYICPQFGRSHVNFQRVPIVDTSNPFMARDIPTADESMVVIRFANPKGIDFQYLMSMLHDSMMTRPNTLVVPGGKMGLAMQMIFTPMILRLMDQKRRT